MSHTFIVAELGSIAEGQLDVMLRQIDAAAEAGCDAVKVQWLSDPATLVKRRNADGYAGAYQRLAWPLEWHATLRQRAAEGGLEYWSSCYLRQDAWPLEPYVDGFKVASFEASDGPLIDTICVTGKPVLVSLGMGGSPILSWTSPRYLHCVSAYPAPMDACNLAVLWQGDRLGMRFSGFSDHTANVLTGAFAVCAGASAVEFHLRLDDSDPGNPDYSCALSPGQAKQYVANIRLAEAAMGNGIRGMQPCEAEMAKYRVGGGQ